jgi:hypothetical protein
MVEAMTGLTTVEAMVIIVTVEIIPKVASPMEGIGMRAGATTMHHMVATGLESPEAWTKVGTHTMMDAMEVRAARLERPKAGIVMRSITAEVTMDTKVVERAKTESKQKVARQMVNQILAWFMKVAAKAKAVSKEKVASPMVKQSLAQAAREIRAKADRPTTMMKMNRQ